MANFKTLLSSSQEKKKKKLYLPCISFIARLSFYCCNIHQISVNWLFLCTVYITSANMPDFNYLTFQANKLLDLFFVYLGMSHLVLNV